MFLNKNEKDMLEGKLGPGVAAAMKILVGIGEAFQSERMVPVNRVHISLSNQEGDLWFAKKMADAGAKCKVMATVNPAYNKKYFEDICTFSSHELQVHQETQDAYKRIGIMPTFQCTPYFENNAPKFKEVVAFAASGASCFVNSVYAARTNRESSQSALCASITGVTPLYGFLLDEYRKGDILIEVKTDIRDDFDFQLLGYTVPKKMGSGVPVFCGLDKEPSKEAFMNLSTELNVHGVVPMFHILGITPEAKTLDDCFHGGKPRRIIEINRDDLEQARKTLSSGTGEISFVILGCPHVTLSQIREVAQLVEGKKLKAELWVFTSFLNKELAERMGLAEIIYKAGGRIIEDSCVDQPIWAHMEGKKGLTESPKCAYYVAKRKMKLIVRSIEECIQAAIRGEVN